MRLEHELQHALDDKQFELYYQPKVEIGSGRITGFEALLRWHHPRLGIIGGADFIPAACDSGLIMPIGEWVIATACAQARQWQDSSPDLAGLPIAVNIAIPQLNHELPAVISRELARHDIAASCLQLEITESLLIRDLQKNDLGAGRHQRKRYHDRHRRFRHRLFIAVRAEAAADRYPQDRPILHL
ncbi:EAL domain-containing protein [Undibacterium arcticum]